MIPVVRKLLLAIAAALGAPGCFAAAEPSLEELFKVEVEGASRYAQPLAEAPATATVISAEDIARYGHETLADALSMARGVYSNYDYAYSLLGVRGFNRPGDYNSRILLLVDGARYNDVVYDQAMVGSEAPVDLNWVKRIEFVPGASSALYGGNALFGIANAILWSGADLNGTRVTAKLGSPGRAGLSVLSGRAVDGGGDWIAGLSLERSGGNDIRFAEFAVPGGSDGVARGLDGEHELKAFARYSGGGWRLSGSYAGRYKDVPTAYYGTSFGVAGNYVRDQHAHLDLTHASTLTPEWGQFGRVHFGWYSFDAEYVAPGLLSRDEAVASWWSGEYRLSYSGLANHQIQFGAEARRNDRMDQRFFDISPSASHLDDRRSGNTVGGFAQDEWRLSRQWIANLGYRLDKVESNQAIGSPRLALIYRPLPELSAKMLYGKAFRAANAYERFYSDGNISQKANPDLKPERIETTELAVDYAVTPALRLGLGHYRNQIHDLIDQAVDPADGLLVFTNRQPLTAQGWEAEAEALLGRGWRVRASMTWQHIDQQGGEPANSPRRLGKLFVDGPFADGGWTLGLGLQAMSERRTLRGSVPGHAVANLTLRQAVMSPYGQWSVSWRNVGDTRYADPGGQEHLQDSLPQPERQWLLRWDYRL
ncbi:MAG TPA: TonB-dependent receptor [Rhodocyclaceae bacterium]